MQLEMLSLQEVFPLLERVSKSPETLECVKEIAEARAERDEARAKLEHTQLQDAWARSSALEQQLADAQAEIGHLVRGAYPLEQHCVAAICSTLLDACRPHPFFSPAAH